WRKIDKGVFELVSIREGGPQLGIELEFERDVLTQGAAQNFLDAGYKRVDVLGFDVERLTTGKSKKTVGQRRGTTGRIHAGFNEFVQAVSSAGLQSPLNEA